MVKPRPENTRRVPHADLNVCVVRNPTPGPNSPILPSRNVYRPSRMNRLSAYAFDCCIRILKDRAVQILEAICILRNLTLQCMLRFNKLLMDRFQVLHIVRVEQIETKPQPDHRGEYGDRLAPLLSSRSTLGPPERLLRRVLPEIDAMSQPVIPVPAVLESPSAIDNVDSDRETGTMVTDDSPVVIVELDHGALSFKLRSYASTASTTLPCTSVSR